VKKWTQRNLAPWLREIVALMRIDSFQEPEALSDELTLPMPVYKLRFKSNQLNWAPLWNQRSASNAKVVGCLVGRQYAMARWLWGDASEPIAPELVETLREGLYQLEVEAGPGITEEIIGQIVEAREKGRADPSLIDYNVLVEPFATIVGKVLQRPLLEVSDFLEGFRLPVHRRATDNAVWAKSFLSSSIVDIMLRDWPLTGELKPLPRLCAHILERLPPRLQAGLKDERLKAAFKDTVRKLCNEIELPIGESGRPPKSRQ